MSAVKLALLADQTRSQTTDGEALAAEPIAVIGVGCRFPGGAHTPEAYWDLVASGTDAITEVPSDRWDIDEFYDTDGTLAGKMNTRWGGFVDGIDQFDAPFFGISPREAERMDPQQRLFMEVAVEALERAGQPIDSLAGSLTGVFVGSSMLDYGEREHAGAHDIDAYSITGNVHCIIPNRFSYTFDLRGPSVSIDTACSSSLVAVHLACQSLRSRDSDLAIAGGVNALLSPNPTVGLAKWNLMAPDGRCKTLDASADGFVRSEGCGVVTLKRLADAISDNDPLLAVIRGSAVNQDGRSTAMTAPNGLAQQDVMRHALRTAQVRPEQVTMMEMHGTGTVLGDPIEVEAIADVLGAAGADAPPIALGAVKTNIGHLEAASGVAGLIKAVLCLQHEAIPAPVHFTELNPHIDLDDTRLFIPTETHAWPRGEQRRIAGVSAFGFGGTNAHLLLEEAPRLPAKNAGDGLPLLLLSAQTPDALRDAATAIADRLDDATSISTDAFSDVAATAARRKTHHPERLAVVAADAGDAVERLRMFAGGERTPAVVTGRSETGMRRRVAFVCSGQGNQWWGMAGDLLEREPAFRQIIERCDELLREHVSWSLVDELTAPEADFRLERTEFAQPAIFAVQVGLAAMLRRCGVEPDAVVGHSIGEVAAAHIAGALSLEDAVRVVAERGAAMADSVDTGAMASVEMSAADLIDAITPFGDTLSIAAQNAPRVTVVSGSAESVRALTDELTARGVAVRALEVTYPFHSAQMAPCGRAVEGALAGLSANVPKRRLVSTVTGEPVTGASLDASYWARNVTDTVRFDDAIANVAASGCDTFIELGPHPVLGGAIRATLAASTDVTDEHVITPTLRRGRPGIETVAATIGELHCSGVEIDLVAAFPGRHRVVPLPTYPWQHRRYWVDTWQPSGGSRPGLASSPIHTTPGARTNPLVGRRLRSPAIDGAVFESWPTPLAPTFLDDHRIARTSIVPGTGFIDMIMGAYTEATGTSPGTLAQLDLLAALVLHDDGAAPSVQVHVHDADADGSSIVVVSSSSDGERWIEHARARMSSAVPTSPAIDLHALRECCPARIDGRDLYATLQKRNIEFGPSFLGVRELWLGDDEAVSRIVAPDEVAASSPDHVMHPALLDAASHSLTALLPDDGTTFLPIAIETLRRHHPLATELWSHVRMRSDEQTQPTDPTSVADVQIADSDGRVLVEIVGLRVARVDAAGVVSAVASEPSGDAESSLYEVAWQSDVLPASQPAGDRRWLIVADEGGLGAALAQRLMDDGVTCDVIPPNVPLAADDVRDQLVEAACTDVVYLRGLDIVPFGTDDDPVAAQRRGLGGALTLAQAMDDLDLRSWIVTRGARAVDGPPTAPEQATLNGFGAGLRAERPDAHCVNVDLDSNGGVDDAVHALINVLGVAEAAVANEVVAVRDGHRFVPRMRPVEPRRAAVIPGAARLASSSYGVLDGLHDQPMERRAPGPGEVEVEVEVTGLNFRDVLVALDLYPERSEVFGDECVGTIVRTGDGVEAVRTGDRVVALAPGAFATHVVTAADLTHRLPDNVGAEDAATIPMTFLTAHYALVMLGKMRAGERVLVHAGAGGVGMAAIQIAQAVGAEVFATAGSDAKRATLADLGVEHVFDSRSLDFADGVLAATDGAGVDLVLNSLADEFIQRSVDVVATDGRFLEIGRRDVWSAERMATERPDIDYHVVFLGDLSVNDPPAIQTMLRELMPRFETGELRPLPRTTYDNDQLVDAFRLMAQARHTGKVVVRRAAPATLDGTYLVTGGTGGIGIEVAGHLIERGVRSMALVSRNPPANEVTTTADTWRAAGVDVRFFIADAADRTALAGVVADIDADMEPLRGIVHAAGVTDDALIADQSWKRIESTLTPKLAGAINLCDLTEGRELAMFVLMSAASPVIGAPGQINYVASNAVLDALATARHTADRPMLSIGWGAWDRVGMTADIDDAAVQRMERRGLRAMPVELALAAFDDADATASHEQPHLLAIDLDRGLLDERGLFAEIRNGEDPTDAADTALLAAWVDTVSGMRRTVISGFVTGEARKVLGLSSGTPIPMRQPLAELGLDSLMAVELRNAIGAALGEPQPATLLFDHPTSAALVDHLLGLVDASSGNSQDLRGSAEDASMTDSAAATDLDDLAGLSEAEAEALLLAELDGSGVGE